MTDCIAESENRVASVSVVLHKWSCSAHQVRAHTHTRFNLFLESNFSSVLASNKQPNQLSVFSVLGDFVWIKKH